MNLSSIGVMPLSIWNRLKRHPIIKSKFKDKDGYIRIVLSNGKIVQEHKWIWNQTFGRVPSGYTIHHINGNKIDNRIENLQMLLEYEHNKLHKG